MESFTNVAVKRIRVEVVGVRYNKPEVPSNDDELRNPAQTHTQNESSRNERTKIS